MENKINRKLLTVALLFAFIAMPAMLAKEKISCFSGLQAFICYAAENENVDRNAIENDMVEKYRHIFDFVSKGDIDIAAQTQPAESGDMAGNDEIKELALELTASCESNSQKAWTLYQWMAQNLYHDVVAESGENQSNTICSDILSNKYTNSDGFANLYTTMCRYAGVPCRKITGLYIQKELSDKAFSTKYLAGKENHAWNEIYIDGKWQPVDVSLDCTNTYLDGAFSKNEPSALWYSAEFDIFAKSHMGMSYKETFNDGNFDYTVAENSITALNYTGATTDVVIPNGVNIVGAMANTSITSVIFPNNGLEKISNKAFRDCVNLADFILPETVKSIGNNAFRNCGSLRNISLPESLESLGSSAFQDCSGLERINVPSNVKNINSNTFNSCTSLNQVTIADGTEKIGAMAFKNCTALENICIPNTVKSIGSSAFYCCEKLKSIDIPEGITLINMSCFSGCTSLEKVSVPNSVTAIYDSAFKDCSSLKSATSLVNVKSVGTSAFENCISLSTVRLTGLTSVSKRTFYNCTAMSLVVLGSNVTEIGESAFENCINLQTIRGGKSITSIRKNAFSSCEKLQSIIFNDNITLIESGAFKNCKKLIKITINSTNGIVPTEAFYGCSALTEVTLGNSISQISEKAFQNCSSLESIELPSGLIIISDYAFSGCSLLTDIGSNLPKSLEYIGINAFTRTKVSCNGNITIPASIGIIKSGAFRSDNGIKTLVIPTRVKTIEEGAFKYITSITDVYYLGTEEGWSDITIGLFNDALKNATIHYMDNGLGHSHAFSKSVLVERSCTTYGKVLFTCSCTYCYVEKLNKSAHTESDWITDIEATCSEVGSKHTECTVCGETLNTDTIDKTAHTETTIPAVTATCTETGLTEGVKCSVCGEIIKAQVETPTVSHTESGWITDIEATCSEVGSKHTECTVCGETLNIYTIDKTAHTETTIPAVSATCTETGLTEGVKCSVCGEIIKAQTKTPTVSHTESNWITDTEATCSKVGSKHKECTACGEILATATIDKIAHTKVAIPAVSATCTETGLTEGVKCSVCGEIITTQVVTPMVSHTESDWITDTEATCSKVGSKHKECTACGEILATATIDKLEHTETTIPAVSASCTKTGLTEGVKCSVCGEIIKAQTETPTVSHTESEWITDTEATCSEVGSKHTECTVCGETLNIYTIDKTAHTETTIPAVSATCTETGLTEGVKCSVCGKIIKAQTETPIVSHIESEWITDIKSTCGEVGSKHTECTVCKATLNTDTIDKTAHTGTTIPAVTSTCTETGLTEGVKCSVCGEIIKAQVETPTVSHTKSNWITDTEATCSEVGSKHTECTVCGEILATARIDKLEHTETTIPAVTATCTETGLTEGVKCSVCGEIIVRQTSTSKLDHVMSDFTTTKASTCTEKGTEKSVCINCGYVETKTIASIGHSYNGSKCTTCGYDRSDNCSCGCHKSGIAHFFFVIVNFFQKLFGNNKVCDCGAKH